MKIKGDEGFTLVETVVALTVVSFALAGILAATNLVTRHNQRLVKTQETERSADETLARLKVDLLPHQPFFATDLTGSSRDIVYDCKTGRCRFHLSAPAQRLVYVSEGEVLTSWPPKVILEGREQRLEALILQDLSGTTLGLVRLETEQSEDCQFDMISRTCRGEGRESTP
jgi:prepilin-type N-terminal cleavage/methylation domain-containing protein